MSLTVTATGTGAASPGILLRVRVLDNAVLPSALNTASATTSGQVSITPAYTGSLVYSAAMTLNAISGPSAGTGNTLVDGVGDGTNHLAYGTYVSTATQTAGVAFTAGSAATTSSISAALEVQSFGGSITTDASSPAPVSSTAAITATTAAFTPPLGGKLILALVSVGASATSPDMTVTDSYGLTWTRAVSASNPAAIGSFTKYGLSGIWYAYTPAAPAVTTTALPGAQLGSSYSATLASSGGYAAYTWAVTTGALPTGLSLSSAGVISGTPSATGLFTFTVTVTDAFGNTATSGSLAIVVNRSFTGTGFIRQGWTAAAAPYTYGTLQVPVSTTDHDWVFVSVSWQSSEDGGIAYCSDNVHNAYQPCAITPPGSTVMTQVFAVPDARAASTVYVSTSAFVRWLTVQVLDVTGLQPGFTIDASGDWAGGPAVSFTESLSTANTDFVLAVGAFAGTPQTITQTGSGATWTSLYGGANGTGTAGITQSVAWASVSGAASPSMQFGGTSGFYGGCMVAVRSAGGLPVNSNPAWPVTKVEAAFGYTPQEPTAPPSWTDITSRYLALNGQRGRSFELDEVSAADITVHLDNFDGALSPGGAYGATLMTPVRVTKTWQGRSYIVFRGLIHAIPQTYDFQRTMTAIAVSDEFSKLSQILLPGAMIQEMLYDKPLHLWPLNEAQGATLASNWSSRSNATLALVSGSGGGGSAAATTGVRLFGFTFPVAKTDKTSGASPSSASDLTTGFGLQVTGTYPAGLQGTQDTVWGNASILTGSSYQGTALVDQNDSTLPLTSTGATYAVWTRFLNVTANTASGATVMVLTGPSNANFLWVYYDGTHVTVSQGTGTWTTKGTFTPPAPLFDGGWHHWAVTVSTGGTVTVYLDGAVLGSFAGSWPAGTPNTVQWGGNAVNPGAASGGFFTGYMCLAGDCDRVVDAERILTWYQSGATGFLDELAGTRIQRVLAWARWSAPQAMDAGATMQQAFNYLGGGYANNGLTGAIGNYQTAGGSVGVDQGAQADMTAQDIAATDTGFLAMMADGSLAFRQRSDITSFPLGLALGDMDYALNSWQVFEAGLGPWTSTVSCTVAQSSGWSYAGRHSALITVTGTPVTAYAWGDKASVTAGQQAGFSCWVMSPQGCTVRADIDWYNASSTLLSTSSGANVNCPPMTPVFLSLAPQTAPANTATAAPHPTLVSSPATGTQLYLDRARISPAGFQCPYEPDVEIIEDIQYLFNDIAITRNVDQATYRARDTTSRAKYYPRIYTRTIYSSVNDVNAVPNAASTLLTAFATPQLRVTRVTVKPSANPEAWPFVLSADIGDTVSFTRTPIGGMTVTGSFMILSVELNIRPDDAQFTYVLAPSGVF